MQDKIDFKVKLGDLVQLQFIPEDGRDRLNAKIIGHAPNKSLIITAPSVGGKLPILKENQPFVVRMLQGSRVYGFQSVVLKYYTLPYPHLHLKQPEEVECIQVRGARRVNTSMVASVQIGADKTYSVTMLNTSSGGALLQTREALGKLNDRISISVELNISGIQKYLRFPAIIRNISAPEDREASDKSKDKDHYRHGVEFVELDDDQKLTLNAFVYEQIVKQMEDYPAGRIRSWAKNCLNPPPLLA